MMTTLAHYTPQNAAILNNMSAFHSYGSSDKHVHPSGSDRFHNKEINIIYFKTTPVRRWVHIFAMVKALPNSQSLCSIAFLWQILSRYKTTLPQSVRVSNILMDIIILAEFPHVFCMSIYISDARDRGPNYTVSCEVKLTLAETILMLSDYFPRSCSTHCHKFWGKHHLRVDAAYSNVVEK